MRSQPYRSGAVICVLLVALCVALAGCFGGGDDTTATTKKPGTTTTAHGSTGSTAPGDTTVASDDELSTFRSKDPFIPQAQPVATSQGPVTTIPGGAPGTTQGTTVTTIPKPPVTVTTPTTSPGGSGGSTPTLPTEPPTTTSTTAPHVHTLKVLSVSQVGGAGAVTFQVDGSVYRDKRVGDVVSTSWGQIKVVDINVSSKVVTLLQGSETLVLSAGQLVYQ
jgi:hypothetical protein